MSNLEILIVTLPLALISRLLLLKRGKKRFEITNKIGRLVGEKKYKDAVALGESNPFSSLEITGKMNLGAAYYFLGEKQKAKDIINTLRAPHYYDSNFKEMLEEWKEKVNKE